MSELEKIKTELDEHPYNPREDRALQNAIYNAELTSGEKAKLKVTSKETLFKRGRHWEREMEAARAELKNVETAYKALRAEYKQTVARYEQVLADVRAGIGK